ncbi:MAG TPA: lactose/cellobiose PTS transporter subunit IIB, partial [Atopobiaceae bacterium]|nr:lactose/cellobiose PTS transporter subunit IIB [Atopobiaceae bacterium]
AAPQGSTLDGKRVLVLCAGGGTSGLLANALTKAAEDHGVGLEAVAGAYGAHLDIMGDYDLVILAPQVASYLPDLQKDAERMGVATAACGGKEYIDLTRDGEKSLRFVTESLKGGE